MIKECMLVPYKEFHVIIRTSSLGYFKKLVHDTDGDIHVDGHD